MMVARVLGAVAIVLALVASAHADDKPWAAGVSAANQKQALALYKEGNAFFEQSQYKDALPKYEAAIALWDHPAIHYNAAVCLINLDRPVEAFENIVSALRFGAAPLGPDLFKQGETYRKMLAAQVGELEVSCADAGAQVTLDGEPIFTGPGSVKRRLRIGDHQIVVTKQRYQTETQLIHLGGGDDRHVAIVLKPVPGQRVLHRRWAKWKPWSLVVGGIAIAAAGAIPLVASQDHATSYQSWLDSCSPCLMPYPANETQEHSLATRDLWIARSAFAVGGALAVTGIALVVLNQPRLVNVTPIAGREQVGLAISGQW